MGWLHRLFGAHAPEDPPENAETRRLLEAARRLSETARGTLPDRDDLRYEARDAALRHGYGEDSPLVELLTDLAVALLDAATVAALPNDLTIQHALRDILAGAELRERLRDTLEYLRDAERHHDLILSVLRDILYEAAATLAAPTEGETHRALFRVPLLTYLEDPADAVSGTIGRLYWDDVRATPLFRKLRDQLTENLETASERHRTKTIQEIAKNYPSPQDFIAAIAHDTPFLDFYSATLPFSIPRPSRFEHLHLLAGSGHGKTQCLQLFILEDLARAEQERFGFALLDSQGDLINKLTRLNVFNPDQGALADRLILIDPNDLSHPVALNLFDYDLERFKDFEPAEREKIFHGVLELYRYIFSSLLGAELTQKQGVVFTNLARAMLAIPKPTLFTFYDFVEDGRQFKEYIERLDTLPRRFFETQFFTPTYSETRKQIITRLLGILSQPVFEKMFGSEQNKIDLFGAMQDGKIIVINTAKDLLKSEGSSMFGRFFIALIAQATQARASLPPKDRTPFHLYIDEAQEYLDQKTAELFNQGRKYNVGVAVAHQNLDQLTTELRATLHASTAIKLVGGANYKDAASFAREMNTTPEHIQSMRKRAHATEFACFVRHHTPRAVSITVPFGVMERAPMMPAPAYMKLLNDNRARVSGAPSLAREVPPTTPHSAEASRGGTPTEEPKHAPAETPKKPKRAPKDDLGFYID
jgi:hypothetical protein